MVTTSPTSPEAGEKEVIAGAGGAGAGATANNKGDVKSSVTPEMESVLVDPLV